MTEIRQTDTNEWTDRHLCQSAGKERQGQVAMETETNSCFSLSLVAFFFSEDIDEQTLCSKTQWPHGTSETTAAGEPKI